MNYVQARLQIGERQDRAEAVSAFASLQLRRVPLLFILSSLAIVANTLISNPRDASIGLGLVLIGLPLYYLWLRRDAR